MRRYLMMGLLLMGLAATLSGCTVKSQATERAFSYACAAGGDCAVYLTVANPSRAADALLGARADVSDRVELHRLISDGQGHLTMQPVDSIPLPASGAVELKPGSTHIMLYQLTRELRAGDTFMLTLLYTKARKEQVQVAVLPEN